MIGERRELYVTFGVKYGTTEEAQAAWREGRPVAREPHPTAEWATGNGYLVVEYTTDPDPLEASTPARERARRAAYAWLDGVYAFDYDERPEPAHASLGEVARIVLP